MLSKHSRRGKAPSADRVERILRARYIGPEFARKLSFAFESQGFAVLLSHRTIITVDGLAGTGKTSLSRALAEKLGFMLLPSGLLYRTIAWLASTAGAQPNDEVGLAGIINKHRVELRHGPVGESVVVDGSPISVDLQRPEFSALSSKIAGLPVIRQALLPVQREAFPGQPLVAEGRDMGTVVFPDAPLKFFVQVADTIRAGRRAAQLGIAPADQPAIEEVLREIRSRDERDTLRALAPTVPAPGAVLIDNSSRSLTEVVNEMYHAALARGIQPGR